MKSTGPPEIERFGRFVGQPDRRARNYDGTGCAVEMEPKDYYEILGVRPDADAEALKRAYRTRARTCHPDHHPGEATAEQFKAVQEAYEVLSDPQRRRRYDALRGSPFAAYARFHIRAGLAATPSGEAPPPDLGDFFSTLFRDVATGNRNDLDAQVRLSFDQALRGGRTEIHLRDGRTVRVTIPKGVRDGLKVRLKGEGLPPSNGTDTSGDLYVTFRVAPSPRFRREGDHLLVTETISAMEAMLGTTRSVTNAYGRVIKLQVPPGTQPGERLRLRGQGVQTARRTGDLFVEIQVQVPRDLTDEQRERLRRAAEDAGLL